MVMRAAIVFRFSRVRRPCDPHVPSLPAGWLSSSRRSFWRLRTVENVLTIYFHYTSGELRYAPRRPESPPMLMPCLAPPNRPSPKPHPSCLGAPCMRDRFHATTIRVMVASSLAESLTSVPWACPRPGPRSSITRSWRNLRIAWDRAFYALLDCMSG